MGLIAAAAAWGFAEATLFFIVPDVLLSAVALRDRRRALLLCLWSLGGALVGGTVMYLWAGRDPSAAVSAVDAVPAVTTEMLHRVRDGLAGTGALAMFFGPLTGTPYKLYAVLSPAAGVGLATFLLVSVPARVIRFVLVVLATDLAARTVLRAASDRTRLAVLLGAWVVFYAAYFTVLT